MVLAKQHQLGDSYLESSRTGMAWSILFLVQKLGCKTLVLVRPFCTPPLNSCPFNLF